MRALSVEEFRKSRRWQDFVEALRLERTVDGILLCEHCGKAIFRKRDCIGHHKRELTEDNVNDATVSLNPDNVDLVHHACHNAIHNRFQGGNPYAKRSRGATVVYGAPCSGKTSYVMAHAAPDDLIIDVDRLFAAISVGDLYDKHDRLVPSALMLRDALVDHVKVRGGKWGHAWIIGGYPLLMDRQRLIDRLGADAVFVDATIQDCLDRCADRPDGWCELVERWFERFQPDAPPGIGSGCP